MILCKVHHTRESQQSRRSWNEIFSWIQLILTQKLSRFTFSKGKIQMAQNQNTRTFHLFQLNIVTPSPTSCHLLLSFSHPQDPIIQKQIMIFCTFFNKISLTAMTLNPSFLNSLTWLWRLLFELESGSVSKAICLSSWILDWTAWKQIKQK